MPVEVSGVKKMLRDLRKVQPEAAKAVTKEVRAAAKPVVTKAKGFAPSQAPLSGWGISRGAWANRTYVAAEVKSGIGFSSSPTKPNRQGFSYVAYIYNKSAAGAIYETAGRKNPNGLPPAQRVTGWTGGAFGQGHIGKVWESGRGVNKSANPNAGKQFIDSMGAIYKAQRQEGQSGRLGRKFNGRLIFRAWGEDQGKVLGAVAKAYDGVVDRFNRGVI